MDPIKTHQESAGDGVRRSLDWDAYGIDWGISHGMQENTKVLTRKNDSPGLDTPRHIFEKRYDFTGWRKQDVKIVKKAFEREKSISQRLNHPHIVAYLGCKDVEKGTPRLYFEYCEGGDLRDDVEPPTSPQATAPSPTPLSLVSPTVYDFGVDPLEVPSPEGKELAEPRRWSESQVWRLIYHLYSALAYLHYGASISNEPEQCVYESSWDPIIHCDINPRNLVLSKRPDGEWDAKICDFGVARDDTKDMSIPKGRGSLYYQPPELGETQWSSKGDVWALAKTIQSLCKGFKTIPHAMKQILDGCRNEEPNARPSSLTVLELAHQHVDGKFPSLERELELAKSKPLIFHAFLTIAKQMDNQVPFETDAAFAKRSGQLYRLGLLLHDGALDEFESSCNELQLAVLFAEYINSLKEKRSGAGPQSQPLPPAAHQDMLEKLVNLGLDPDEQWPISGWTALHIAAQQGSSDMVQRLLNAKAKPSQHDTRGWTPRQYASRIRTLWEGREIQATSNIVADKAQRPLDQARAYVLQRQLSSIQSNKKAFEAVEDILWQAEDVKEGADEIAVKENMYSNADAFEFNRNI